MHCVYAKCNKLQVLYMSRPRNEGKGREGGPLVPISYGCLGYGASLGHLGDPC